MLTDDMYMSSVIDLIKPAYFTDNNIKEIIDIVTNFYQKRGVLPTSTDIKSYLVTPELKTSYKELINSFNEMEKSANTDELYDLTERFIKEKAIYECITKTVNDYSKNIINPAETFDIFEKACNISLIDNLGHDYFNSVPKYISDLKEAQQYLSTGWKWLDQKLGGGWLKTGRALYAFSGFTNSGKSIFLANTAVNALKQNKVVLIISLEMSELVYSNRISAQITNTSLSGIQMCAQTVESKIYEYNKQYPGARLIIKEFPPKSVTCNHIKSYIKKLYNKHIHPDIIIIDYVNLLEANIPTGNSYEDVKSITEHLRALSYTFKCPVVTATQLGRSGAGVANPGLELTSESIGLSYTVDAQFGIWSDDKDRELGIIHMGIQKNRFGPNTGTTALKIDYNTLSISEINDDFFQETTIKNTINDLDNFLENT